MTGPKLSGVVVHWRAESALARLVAAWPQGDSRFELLVVDNGSRGELSIGDARLLEPGRNLGFAGGANLGAREARGDLLLFLNPDARPLGDSVAILLEGEARYPEAAGLVPRLVGEEGDSQARWQLRPLPTLADLYAQAFFLPRPHGAAREPAAGTAIGQPAAAALAVRRDVFESVGGFDERFIPAWFEDVDLAKRLAARGDRLVYLPESIFLHERGVSVPELGYARFLRIYAANLVRYARKHHGAGAAPLRFAVAAGAWWRLALLPVRRPRRAASRAEAARALRALASSALRRFPIEEGGA